MRICTCFLGRDLRVFPGLRRFPNLALVKLLVSPKGPPPVSPPLCAPPAPPPPFAKSPLTAPAFRELDPLRRRGVTLGAPMTAREAPLAPCVVVVVVVIIITDVVFGVLGDRRRGLGFLLTPFTSR